MKLLYLLGLLAVVVLLLSFMKECPDNCVKTGIGSCKCHNVNI